MEITGLGSGAQVAPSQEAQLSKISLDGEGESSFAETLKAALADVSELQARSQDAIGAFLRGEPVEIHEVMAAAEEAGIALEMLIEIRNKLTEAYRTISQMQQ